MSPCSGSEVLVQQDIIEYMFLLDGLAGGGVNHQRHDVSPMTAEASNGIPDIKWWQRAIDEAISRLHRYEWVLKTPWPVAVDPNS